MIDEPDAKSLDPADWSALRALGHRMLDDMIDHLARLRERPVWQEMPPAARAAASASPAPEGANPADLYETFRRIILPYASANQHPRFMGWVQGGGNAIGMLAEMLAAGLNLNCGGRNHAGIEIEGGLVRWMAELVGFPATAGGLFVTGSSMANLIAVLAARRAALGPIVRRSGLGAAPLVAYASSGVHGCVPKALDIAGSGTEALRLVATDEAGRIDPEALTAAIAADYAAGFRPFLVVGSAGTVDTGAVDDLAVLAEICHNQRLWFHVDGAFGALALLSPALHPLLAGIEAADSLAVDFHKWGQVPYDAGLILVREQERLLDTFAQPSAYLRQEARGLAAGAPWPCDLGPELSRGFRALKVWFTLHAYGPARLGAVIERSCALARALAARIDAEPALERLAPVALNVVCFRYVAAGHDLDRLNADIVADIQEAGIAAPSTTTIGGRLAIRAAIVNHRSEEEDLMAMLDAVLACGKRRAQAAA